MNKVLLTICRFLGFKRKKPKTKLGLALRWCEYGLGVFGICYLLLLSFPQPLFAYSYRHEGISIYSTEPIPESAQDRLSSVHTRIRTSTLHQEEDTFRVFLCNNKKLFTLLTATHRHSFAVSFPFIENIIIADGDFEQDLCYAFRGGHNTRSLSGVITHEMGHTLLRRKFGFWHDLKQKKWLKEGYCEMLADDSSFPAGKGAYLMLSGQSDPSVSFQYFTYWKMMTYLISHEGYTIEQLVKTPPNMDTVYKSTQVWLGGKNIEILDPTWTTPVD